MASLELRNGSYRFVFLHNGRKRSFTMGHVSETEALNWKWEAESLLISIKRGFVEPNVPISKYLYHLGPPPAPPPLPITLDRLRDEFLAASARRLEPTTMMTYRCQFRHLVQFFGTEQLVRVIGYPDLQKYVDKRLDATKGNVSRDTIQKEIKLLRVAWKWARRMLGLQENWPGSDLSYPKGCEHHPFMTLDEIARHDEGENRSELYAAVYLRPAEIAELLEHVRSQRLPYWVWPMFVFAAHTGARRSEIVRARTEDVNLERGIILLRERKRDSSRHTFRHVVLTPFLEEALAPLLARPGLLFRNEDGGGLGVQVTAKYFHKALKGSPWAVLRGWHTFRHSFISALASAGVDQRIIDDLVGHSTEEQRRRYRHLFPSTKSQAVLSTFADHASRPLRLHDETHSYAPPHQRPPEQNQRTEEPSLPSRTHLEFHRPTPETCCNPRSRWVGQLRMRPIAQES